METNGLKDIYVNLLTPYGTNEQEILACWKEIEQAYTDPRRHYHNFAHLISFSGQLDLCKDLLKDYPTAFLAMVYHDVVYFMPDGTNEERSADFASKHLQALGLPGDKIELCVALILATKTHEENIDPDINYFTDADMSILGHSDDAYKAYSKGIRKEYGEIPQFNAGRKKVLQGFLEMDRIYKTELFWNRYETKARENILGEIDSL